MISLASGISTSIIHPKAFGRSTALRGPPLLQHLPLRSPGRILRTRIRTLTDRGEDRLGFLEHLFLGQLIQITDLSGDLDHTVLKGGDHGFRLLPRKEDQIRIRIRSRSRSNSVELSSLKCVTLAWTASSLSSSRWTHLAATSTGGGFVLL